MENGQEKALPAYLEIIHFFPCAEKKALKIVYAEKDFLTATLTTGQIRRLPSVLQDMITVPNFKGQFFFG